MATLANLARMNVTGGGTGTLTLLTAGVGALTFAQAGVPNGATVSYSIINGTQMEVGRGVYSSTGPTLTRGVLRSTNANALINVSGAAQVFVTALAEDFGDINTALAKRVAVDAAQAFSDAEKYQALTNIGAGQLMGFRNKLLNSVFTVWQRGTSFSAIAHTADRWHFWKAQAGDALTVARGVSGGAELNSGYYRGRYYLQANFTGSAGNKQMYQTIEGVQSLRGEVTLGALIYNSGAAFTINGAMITQVFDGSASLNNMLGAITINAGWNFIRHKFTMASLTGKTIGANSRLDCYIFNDNIGTRSLIFGAVALVEGDYTAVSDIEEFPWDIPDEATQLEQCRRFYRKLTIRALASVSGTPEYLSELFDVHGMRGTPSVTKVDTNLLNVGATQIAVVDNGAGSLYGQVYSTALAAGSVAFTTDITLACEI